MRCISYVYTLTYDFIPAVVTSITFSGELKRTVLLSAMMKKLGKSRKP